MNENNKLNNNSLQQEDNTLSGLELAEFIKYIFNVFMKKPEDKYKNDFTHLKLQKIMWFSYLNYLRRTGEKLVNEDFEAWTYGPVLKTVFNEYNSFGSEVILKEYNKKLSDKILKKVNKEQLKIIAETCKMYKSIGAFNLVLESHDFFWNKYFQMGRKVMPWSEVKINYYDNLKIGENNV